MRNSFVMCLSPRTVIYNCQKLKNDVEVKFFGSRQPVTANVLQIDVGGLSKLPVSIPTKGYLKIHVY
jgi:hypothetical protein